MYPSAASVDRLQASLGRDLAAFTPELILCSAIVFMLVARLFGGSSRTNMGYVTLAASIAALIAAILQWTGEAWQTDGCLLFTGLLVFDPFAIYIRALLLLFTSLLSILTLLTGIPDTEDSVDFSTLLLGSVLGMMLMAAANHLLMVFLAVEMASVPSYALAGFMKGRRQGSEAALKYVVYGASASGIMLYGISLLAGRFGTGYLPEVAAGCQTALANGGLDPALAVGALFLVVGFGFKLAAAPFHFWCPDVFEGAAAEVAAFLSVASKAAAMAMTARVLIALQGPPGARAAQNFSDSIGVLLAALAAITVTLGNLAALAQTNLKRLLAYSTIAHAGYMLLALIPLSVNGVQALLFYLTAYLLMNLGAFACVAFARNMARSEDLGAMGGLVQQAPAVVVAMAIFLLSLLGLPPLAGFAAKFQVFTTLYDASKHAGGSPTLSSWFLPLLIVAAFNTVISAAYYLRVLRVMILDAPAENQMKRLSGGPAIYCLVLAALVFAVGLLWGPILTVSQEAAASLFPVPLPR